MNYESKRIPLKNGSSVLFRAPSGNDAAEMLGFLKAAYAECEYLLRYPEEMTFTPEGEGAYLSSITEDHDRLMIVVEADGGIVGNGQIEFQTTFKTRHRAEIMLALREEYCGKGIGTSLLCELEAAARARGVGQLELSVIEGNDRAIGLYRKAGFTEAGRLPDAIRFKDRSVHAIITMRKVLTYAEKRLVCGIPAIVYGSPASRVFLYVHGLMGCKEEAKALSETICPFGYQILAIDLPKHGERKEEPKELLPWNVLPELSAVLAEMKKEWPSVSLFAVSIGAYLSLLAFGQEKLDRVLFVSPLPDMRSFLDHAMRKNGISEKELEEKKTVSVPEAKLSWEYYTYVKENPIVKWDPPTFVLYAEGDAVVAKEDVCFFCDRFGASLTVSHTPNHWFHTPQDLAERDRFIRNSLK